MANNFNMVAFMDSLVEGGFTERQAKSLATALYHLIDSHLVTKDYLDARLAEFRIDFKLEMATMKSELIQWMCGVVIVQTGMTAVLFKLLH
ncbi:hypothetical protein GJ698_07630 [Pseudoduganella sp. FT26W]|uniref:DUF1640 domain-containing protein n=1 Tax=Duganella aquatilis TaxID=2666082 RepID=A0A844D744_9BURK|nr:hypothetical protein [Duganella aquatilis]MRW83966.1 hypothetical protein [Duganella aquatilis]